MLGGSGKLVVKVTNSGAGHKIPTDSRHKSYNLLVTVKDAEGTETYRAEERSKAQGLNEFLVFGTVTLTALSSGALFHAFGWLAVNLGIVAPLLVVLTAVLWLARRRAGAAVASSALE